MTDTKSYDTDVAENSEVHQSARTITTVRTGKRTTRRRYEQSETKVKLSLKPKSKEPTSRVLFDRNSIGISGLFFRNVPIK
ncbi:unnamed protein product, partial [Rotaria sordida]